MAARCKIRDIYPLGDLFRSGAGTKRHMVCQQLYKNPDGPERKYHEATYGPLEKFGYKDFIPMFTGEKFNADEWADLFRKAGATFCGTGCRASRWILNVGHKGFRMNAARMGPKRDVVGELSVAIKKRR